MIDVETVTDNLRFPGQYFNTETGLLYNNQRYYEQGSGQYLQIDPIGFAGGDINLYTYVAMNPVNLADPRKLEVPELSLELITAMRAMIVENNL